MNISPYIFRGYDIRAVYGEDLDESVATVIGKAYGSYILRNGENKVIVGRDNRAHSLSLQTALIEGLISTGVHVINIGMCTTPIYYFSREIYSVKPGIMVTASHNPPKYNGFKMSTYGDERLFGEGLQVFKDEVLEGNFIEASLPGEISEKHPIEQYVSMIVDKCQLGERKLKVVVDCGNASAGLVAEKILAGIGCEVVPLYCDLDSAFPNHEPDPANLKNMQDLIKKVLETGADLGVGLDGDCDRVGIVDEKGHVMVGDEFMMVMIKEILPKYPGAKVPVEVKCTYAFYEDILKLGGVPFYHRTGNACLYDTIKRMDLPFVGEMSGHVFFADEYYGFDDGMYAACRFIRHVSNTDKLCSELLKDSNKYFSTPEMIIATTDAVKFEQVEKIKQYFKEKGLEIIDVDGVRVIFQDGWGLVRASNTGPNLTVRCEARTPEGLEEIKAEMELSLNLK